MATIGMVLLGYALLAAAQEGPMQVWLLVLAPLALVAVALLLDISDPSRYD